MDLESILKGTKLCDHLNFNTVLLVLVLIFIIGPKRIAEILKRWAGKSEVSVTIHEPNPTPPSTTVLVTEKECDAKHKAIDKDLDEGKKADQRIWDFIGPMQTDVVETKTTVGHIKEDVSYIRGQIERAPGRKKTS
jgi:hypothetical protein